MCDCTETLTHLSLSSFPAHFAPVTPAPPMWAGTSLCFPKQMQLKEGVTWAAKGLPIYSRPGAWERRSCSVHRQRQVQLSEGVSHPGR